MTHDCIQCDFHGRAPGHLKKHLETKKHINIINGTKKHINNMYTYLYYRENHHTIKRQSKINYYKAKGKDIRFIKVNT